jgi:hypothetical protein
MGDPVQSYILHANFYFVGVYKVSSKQNDRCATQAQPTEALVSSKTNSFDGQFLSQILKTCLNPKNNE